MYGPIAQCAWPRRGVGTNPPGSSACHDIVGKSSMCVVPEAERDCSSIPAEKRRKAHGGDVGR